MPQEEAYPEDICSKSLAEHRQGRNPVSGDVYCFRQSLTTNDLQPPIKNLI